MPLKEPIVIDNFQKGIAPSPLFGFEDMAGLDLEGIEGSARVGFNSVLNGVIPDTVAAAIESVNTTANTIVLTKYPWANGSTNINILILRFAGTVPTGISINTDYYCTYTGISREYKLYTTYAKAVAGTGGTEVDITATTTGATVTMIYAKNIIHVAKYRNWTFLQDEAYRIWAMSSSNELYPVDGNDITTASSGNGKGLIVYKNYLLSFKRGHADALSLVNFSGENTLTWNNTTSFNPLDMGGFADYANPILGTDDTVYWLVRDLSNNAWTIGSIFQKPDEVFDPASATTYTLNTNVLDLPEDPTCLCELDKYLMIGTQSGNIYRWDRVSSSFNIPLDTKTRLINTMINVFNRVYVFSYSNDIIVTDGTSVGAFYQIPNHLHNYPYSKITTGSAYPNQAYVYGSFGAVYSYDKLYFFAGSYLYSLDINTKRLQKSSALFDRGTATPLLTAIWLSDVDYKVNYSHSYYRGVSKYAISYISESTDNISTDYSSYLISPVYNIGSFNNKITLNGIEAQFGKKLLSGHGIKLYYRENMDDSWILIKEISYSTVGGLKSYRTSFGYSLQSFQIKVEIAGNSSSSPILKNITIY